MKAALSHVQFNVRPESLPFYRDLLAFLAWRAVYDDPQTLGVECDAASLWFAGQVKDVSNDYDGPGMNHLALRAESQADVDAAAAFLSERGVELLFETPRHRPEFSDGADQTYYQVMFESPDHILFEVVYTGPKPA